MSDLPPELQAALAARLTALADDELILGHRNSEWTGHAPILEEDIAIANVAQDEIGHAVLYYGLVNELTGVEPDSLAFKREPAQFMNSALVEQERGDWAFTMLRQYLYDVFEDELLQRLTESAYSPLKDVAAKIAREEIFHLRHSALWVERLAHGTEESVRRLEAALIALWPLYSQLLAPLPGDAHLTAAGIYPAAQELSGAVISRAETELARLGLSVPQLPTTLERTRPAEELEAGLLAELVREMQQVARSDMEAEAW